MRLITSRYRYLAEIVRDTAARFIVEIGTHKGVRAEMMCREALETSPGLPVHYRGYDLFDAANPETNVRENNGKGAGSSIEAARRLEKLQTEFPDRFTFELIRGDTHDTLHGTHVIADLVWVDGGHSHETVAGDYEAVRGSKVVAMDDYYGPDAQGRSQDVTRFGCNKVVDADPAFEVLPWPDLNQGIGGVSRVAVRGWDRIKTTSIESEWWPAVETTMRAWGAHTVTEYKAGPGAGAPRRAECIFCDLGPCETKEQARETVDLLRHYVDEGAFFACPLSLDRGEGFWNAVFDGLWKIQDRAPIRTQDGTEHFAYAARAIREIGEIYTRAAEGDKVRSEQMLHNIKRIKERVPIPVASHDRQAVVCCYGPSLKTTWEEAAALVIGDQDHKTDLVTVSGSHDFMVLRGVVPHYHFETDPRVHKAKHVNKIHKDVNYLLASCVHPAVVDKLRRRKAHVFLWHAYEGQWSFDLIVKHELGAAMVGGGANAGLRSLAVLHAMGYRKMHVFGMDCSFGDGPEMEQHAGGHAGRDQPPLRITCDGKEFWTSPLYIAYARGFFEQMRAMAGMNITLYGDGLLQTMAAAEVREFEKGQSDAA